MKTKWMKKLLVYGVIVLLSMGSLIGCKKENNQDNWQNEQAINNPKVTEMSTTWDCVFFGSYWKQDSNGDWVVNPTDEKDVLVWRVLSVNDTDGDGEGDEALLLADNCVELLPYDYYKGRVAYSETSWESCSLREWLNNDFYRDAFSQEQKASIKEKEIVTCWTDEKGEERTERTQDKIFLLSIEDINNEYYGFEKIATDEPGVTGSKTLALDSEYVTSGDLGYERENFTYFLRTPRNIEGSVHTISKDGMLDPRLNYAKNHFGIRPAMFVDIRTAKLSKTSKMYVSHGEVNQHMEESGDVSLEDPRVKKETTTWHCVNFGSYWYEDSNGDGKVDPDDIKKSIKWRVLSVDDTDGDGKGDEAVLFASNLVDCLPYDYAKGSVYFEKTAWGNSSLRNWLNNEFYQSAFSEEEKASIKEKSITTKWNNNKGKEEKEVSKDKVWLLSYDEIQSRKYGFEKLYEMKIEGASYDAYPRGSKLLVYDDDMEDDEQFWWLRGKIDSHGGAYVVSKDGKHYNMSFGVTIDYGVRPVVCVDISAIKDRYVGTITLDRGMRY